MTEKNTSGSKSPFQKYVLINPSAATEFSVRYKSRMTKIAEVINGGGSIKIYIYIYISIRHKPILLTSRYSDRLGEEWMSPVLEYDNAYSSMFSNLLS
jgi:hypothetical protein